MTRPSFTMRPCAGNAGAKTSGRRGPSAERVAVISAATCPRSVESIFLNRIEALRARPLANARRTMRRATTPESVLEAVYELAGRTPPGESAADVFRGHPLAVPPTGAAAIFYGIWPAAMVAAGALVHGRQI